MGTMSGRKSDSDRQATHTGRQLATVTAITGDAELEPPAPTPGWLKATKASWAELWDADVAKSYGRHHMPALYRLFQYRDMYLRASQVYKKSPFVEGSQGQPVMSPAFKTMTQLEASITALEDRLGLTPKAQANLGIAIGQHMLTAADLNRLAETAGGGDHDGDSGGETGDEYAGWTEAPAIEA